MINQMKLKPTKDDAPVKLRLRARLPPLAVGFVTEYTGAQKCSLQLQLTGNWSILLFYHKEKSSLWWKFMLWGNCILPSMLFESNNEALFSSVVRS